MKLFHIALDYSVGYLMSFANQVEDWEEKAVTKWLQRWSEGSGFAAVPYRLAGRVMNLIPTGYYADLKGGEEVFVPHIQPPSGDEYIPTMWDRETARKAAMG
jgi:hypothetical protein